MPTSRGQLENYFRSLRRLGKPHGEALAILTAELGLPYQYLRDQMLSYREFHAWMGIQTNKPASSGLERDVRSFTGRREVPEPVQAVPIAAPLPPPRREEPAPVPIPVRVPEIIIAPIPIVRVEEPVRFFGDYGRQLIHQRRLGKIVAAFTGKSGAQQLPRKIMELLKSKPAIAARMLGVTADELQKVLPASIETSSRKFVSKVAMRPRQEPEEVLGMKESTPEAVIPVAAPIIARIMEPASPPVTYALERIEALRLATVHRSMTNNTARGPKLPRGIVNMLERSLHGADPGRPARIIGVRKDSLSKALHGIAVERAMPARHHTASL